MPCIDNNALIYASGRAACWLRTHFSEVAGVRTRNGEHEKIKSKWERERESLCTNRGDGINAEKLPATIKELMTAVWELVHGGMMDQLFSVERLLP